MTLFRRFLAVGLTILLVSACATPVTEAFPGITFRHLPNIALAVGGIEVGSTFKPSIDLPHVETEMPVNAANVVKRWAADRLVTTGDGTGTARYTVTDASVIAKALDTDKTLKAWFTDEQAVRYTVNLGASLRIDDTADGAQGMAEAKAERSITVPEGATLNERDQALFNMISAAATDLNNELEKNVRRHLDDWLR